MVERSELVHALRQRFRDGATPLRLIRDIVARLGETASSREVQEILADTFQLPVVRVGPLLDISQKRYGEGILNRTLLAEIVENRERWQAVNASPPKEPCWLDGLSLSSPEAARSKVAADAYPGLSRESWAALTPEEQQALSVQMASGQVLSQRVELLARLAERLQEQVDELQRRVGVAT
jgi:hypothetical protein